ncbi:MAG: RNA polymerase sigma factor [Sandaracinaceae bacterium]
MARAPISLDERREGGPTDAALVMATRHGDAWASDALFARYARLVHGLAFRLLGSDADVDDLVQDAFVEAFSNLHRLNEPSSFRSWLCSIVVRTAHKRLRRRALLTRLGLRRNEPVDVDALPLHAAPPDVAAHLRRIYALLHQLHPEERVALVLRRVEGLELAEIAARMDLSMTTVKRRLAAADAQLAILAGEGGAR